MSSTMKKWNNPMLGCCTKEEWYKWDVTSGQSEGLSIVLL